MYKQLFALSLTYLTTQAAWAEEQFTPLENQHCPDVQITSLFPLQARAVKVISEYPLQVEPVKGWTVTTHEIHPDSYGKEKPILDDVRSYEAHVVTNYLYDYKTSDTVTLNSCQYGVHWNKYNTNFYYKEHWLSRAAKASVSYYSHENYYDSYNSLIVLTPTIPSTITMSVPSILYNNYSGWTKRTSQFLSTTSSGLTIHGHEIWSNVWGVWFDCYPERVSNEKCTWTTVNQTQPIPSSIEFPHTKRDEIYLLP